MGYIFSKQGKGSYVQNQKLQIPLILTGDVSFSEKMKELKYESKTINLSCEKIPYDSSIYHTLQANREDAVFKISRLRIVEDCPIAVYTSYLSQSLFETIEKDGKEIHSVFHYYRQQEEKAGIQFRLLFSFDTIGTILQMIINYAGNK
jgi:GntR family transcriptional regulator